MSVIGKKKLQSLGRGYLFSLEMERLARAASRDEQGAAALLEELLPDCLDMENWHHRGYWCSAVIRALVFSGTGRSLKSMLNFLKDLPDNTTYGCIELLAGLLPAYGRRALKPLRELADNEEPGPARAIAIQALCNYLLEGLLLEEDIGDLRRIAGEFKSDPYLTKQVLELVENRLQERSSPEIDRELEQFLNDVIVDT